MKRLFMAFPMLFIATMALIAFQITTVPIELGQTQTSGSSSVGAKGTQVLATATVNAPVYANNTLQPLSVNAQTGALRVEIPSGVTFSGTIGTVGQGSAGNSANPWPMAFTNTSDVLVKPGDSVNNAIRVNCVASSCAAPGSFNLVDKSGSITLGGTAQTQIATNSSRHSVTIQNYSTNTAQGIANAESLWISFTGTAVCGGGANTFELLPGATASIGLIGVSSTQAVSICGATTGHKFYGEEQ